MHTYHDCSYRLEGSSFTVSNARIKRVWDLSSGIPVTTSLLDLNTGEQWLDTSQPLPLFHFSFFRATSILESKVEAVIDDDLLIAEKHLKVVLCLEYEHVSVMLVTRIYPAKPFLRHELLFKLKTASLMDEIDHGHESIQLQLDDNNKEAAGIPGDYIDALPFRERHGHWSSAFLRDITDHHNNLVSEESGLFYINEQSDLTANLLMVNNPLTQGRLFFLKESPTPLAQLHYPGHDYRFIGQKVFMTGGGLVGADLRTDRYMPVYGSVIGMASGREEALLRALHHYHSSIRSFKKNRDCLVMSNTWGDRSKDSRVNEAFLLEELEAAAQTGIGILQIDDGWQQGATANSVVSGGVWSGYYSHQDNFWQEHADRFPNGLEPIVRRAAELGVKLGLWFSPDSSENFANWLRDAEVLLHLHARHGVNYFKLDAIHIRSKAGEVNLVNMMEHVIRESGAAVIFNLDTTAQIRLGYFGRNQYGCLFLENRYTDWVNYFPHYTLRNLWMLSKYMPARTLQIEYLNVERNRQLYGDDPLSPAKCGFAYAFGVTIAGNPLAWMELSGLSVENRELLHTMLSAYRHLQAELAGGMVLPIGEEPSGFGWTGFQSLSTSESRGMLVLYRENSSEDTYSFRLWETAGRQLQLERWIQCEGGIWSGNGLNPLETLVLQPDAAGHYGFQHSQPHSFSVYKYSFF